MSSNPELLLASPTDRFAAFVADAILLQPLLALLISPLKRQAVDAQMMDHSGSYVVALVGAAIAGVIGFLAYQTIFISWWGATPGKRAFGLRVEPLWAPQTKPKPLAAFLRACALVLEVLCLGLPWIAVFGNERRRPFHDRVGDTVVVSRRRHRAVGAPSLSEVSMASGVTAACLMMIGLVVVLQMAKLKSSIEGDVLAADLEETGSLCSAVGEAERAWIPESGMERPSRIAIAITLFQSDTVDEDCLRQESEYALWREGDKAEGYLARALAEGEDSDQAEVYMTKVCESAPQSDACRAVTILNGPGDDEDAVDAKASEANFETQVDLIASRDPQESAPYLRVLLVRHFAVNRRDDRVLELLDSLPPEKSLAYFLTSERAKALWNLDRKAEARLAMRASTTVSEPAQRADIARWFCDSETSSSGCSSDARRACDILGAVVDSRELFLLQPEIAVSYLRGETCADRLDSERLADLEGKMSDEEARTYVRALARLAADQRDEAQSLFTKIASGEGKTGPLFIEANARLTELATTADELAGIRQTWGSADPTQEGWRLLGRRLMERYNALRAWDQSVSVGLKIAENDAVDVSVARSMVVAAFRAGHVGMAANFLEKITHSRTEEASHDRAPASSDGFEDVVRELTQIKKGAR